jgi:quercetin dioxygenase-like cupin family protein
MLSILGASSVPVIRRADSRRTRTPNAVMTTFASPTQGGSAIALWRVDMAPGSTGPLHAFDTEQVWTVLDGGATVTLDGEDLAVAAGDSVVLPAGALRRVAADPHTGVAVVVAAAAGARAAVPGDDPVLPAWVA